MSDSLDAPSKAVIRSPLGLLQLEGDSQGVSQILFNDDCGEVTPKSARPNPLLRCIEQLEAYFRGDLQHFSLQLNPSGTVFQQNVWHALSQIPYGETRSYKTQALQLGNLKAIRAVASANGKNPIPIIIPCHRVIGSDGSLTGYAGGLWRKQWLLKHENSLKQYSLF